MEETRLAKETALARAKHEKAKSLVALEAAETSRKDAELEARKRMGVGSGYMTQVSYIYTVSYTHLTLPTNREV